MGAEQSSPRNGDQAPAATTIRKTCYYELLGLDRQATDDEIRKAYRRKALELHPDRNLHDTENATQKFAQVQTAYEILSDPQERAWYDSHRDAILAGHDDFSQAPAEHYNTHLTSSEDIFSLMGRFNSSVPMSDSPKGFFGILNAFFDQLAMEEAAACEWEGLAPVQYPPFGSSTDNYDDVARSFYNVWTGFSTKKQFSWKDKYRLSDAPDRRIRRLMEKENKKFRDEGIRDFNDAVRSLVAFVKKRDPRYVPNKQSEAERQKVLRDSAAAQAARSRAANQEKLSGYVVPEWAQSRPDEDYNDEFELTEEESEVEHIECIICNKTFKSEKQFEAHEKSKKHIKAVQQLKWQMKKENADFDLNESPATPTADAGATSPSATSEEKNGEVIRGAQESQGDKDGDHGPSDLPDSPDSGAESADDLLGDEYAPRSEVEDRLVSGRKSGAGKAEGPEDGEAESLALSVDDLTIDESATEEKKIGKAKARREKKAARLAANASQTNAHACAVCKEVFSSRTKLFSHINEVGHAAPVPQKARVGKRQKR